MKGSSRTDARQTEMVVLGSPENNLWWCKFGGYGTTILWNGPFSHSVDFLVSLFYTCGKHRILWFFGTNCPM
jgi:hypothetical protein